MTGSETQHSGPARDDRSQARLIPAGAHLPVLDGIRGLAIVLVLLFHSAVLSTSNVVQKVVSSAWVGVDLFFVLSGFLITGILLDSRLKENRFRHFYARRFLRIFPLYYATLILVFLTPVGLLIAGDLIEQGRQQQGWFWLHMQNWRCVLTNSWNFAPLNHFWSLAIEEQFYLIWPLVVFLAGPRRLAFIAFAVLIAGLSARIALVADGTSPIVIYSATFLRLDGFMTGALAALVVRTGLEHRRVAKYAFACTVASLIPLGLLMRRPQALLCLDPWTQTIGFTLLAALFAALILIAVTVPNESIMTRTLRWSPLRFMGKYSYAIYVFHFPILFALVQMKVEDYPRFMQAFAVSHPRLLNLLLMVGASISLALISWNLFEKRFLRLKKYTEPSTRAEEQPTPAMARAA